MSDDRLNQPVPAPSSLFTFQLERVARLELASSAWKAEVLPLNYTRVSLARALFPTCHPELTRYPVRTAPPGHCASRSGLPRRLVEGGGFEPPKLARQIYSLIPLATREPLQKAAVDSALGPTLCQLISPRLHLPITQ